MNRIMSAEAVANARRISLRVYGGLMVVPPREESTPVPAVKTGEYVFNTLKPADVDVTEAAT